MRRVVFWSVFVLVFTVLAGNIVLVRVYDCEWGVVGSNSMKPSLEKGDLIIIRPCGSLDIQEGDIICYNANGSNIIHRVEHVEMGIGEMEFVTKGDSNEFCDNYIVTYPQVKGRLVFSVRHVGSIVDNMCGSRLYIWIAIIAEVLAFVLIIRRFYNKGKKKTVRSK